MQVDASPAERLRAVLAERPHLEEKKMFGGHCWMFRGNMLCATSKQRYMFRVGGDQEAEALSRPGARPMDITGRPMKGFVWVDADAVGDAELPGWIALAERYVAFLPAK